MLLRSFLVGLVLGLISGALALEAGVFIVVLVVPTFLWGAQERGTPVGCAGLLVGAGTGMVALLAWSQLRCAADPSCHLSTPLEGFYLMGGVLALLGLLLLGVGVARRGRGGRGVR